MNGSVGHVLDMQGVYMRYPRSMNGILDGMDLTISSGIDFCKSLKYLSLINMIIIRVIMEHLIMFMFNIYHKLR